MDMLQGETMKKDNFTIEEIENIIRSKNKEEEEEFPDFEELGGK